MTLDAHPARGVPIVLTADRILFARYETLLDGMMAAAQTTATPGPVMRGLLSPRAPSAGGRALVAPLGLRSVEAELAAHGFGPRLAVCAPEDLAQMVGPDTRLVLISSGDPLGIGMNDATMSGLGGGRPYNGLWFERVAGRLRALRRGGGGFRVMAGGPGAWQLQQRPEQRASLGIDTVFVGYAEGAIADAVGALADGGSAPEVIEAPVHEGVDTPPILGASSMGVVEVSRGCGLGCPFCTMAGVRMAHVPVERVVRNVRTNVAGGVANVVLAGEDFLRYGAQGRDLRPEAVLALAEAVRGVEGVRLIQLDHVNVASAAGFPQDDLGRVFAALTRGTGQRWVWVNLGVESASGRLLAASGCRAKLHPFAPDQWRQTCEAAVRKLVRAGFMPMISLLFGLPGETAEDLRDTLEFVRSLRGLPVLVFPLFRAPLRPEERASAVGDMTGAHWDLTKAAYALNSRWLPRLYWDNHTAAGVGLGRRAAIQAGGRAKVLEWRARFALASRRAR